jgi:surface protein
MKHFKYLLFLSILCSLVLFTNCGEDSEDAITSKPTLTITIFPSGGGSVSPQGGTYDAGTTVELTATANVDYTFTGWTGDFTGSSNPVTLTMLTNQTVIANYEFHDADGDGVGDSVDNCAETASDATVDENGCSDSYEIYLDPNGVTIKAADNAVVGESYILDSVSYLVVDSALLYEMMDKFDQPRSAEEDAELRESLTKVVTTRVNSIHQLFTGSYDKTRFNEDISSWDVSNVTDMSDAFLSNSKFNQDIGSWDVSNVTNMSRMFEGAAEFNHDINSWNVSNVAEMHSIFKGAQSFDQDISSWNISSEVTNMSEMFSGSGFNHDIGHWDMSNVTKIGSMLNRSPFNQDISSWDVSNVTEIGYLFRGNIAFNQDIGSWDVSGVKDMDGMFDGATAFNQDISSWDVSGVEEMYAMFEDASNFNQDISSWDVGSVTNMGAMFESDGYPTTFNQDLSSWDVSNVTYCSRFSYSTPDWTEPKPNFTNCTE